MEKLKTFKNFLRENYKDEYCQMPIEDAIINTPEEFKEYVYNLYKEAHGEEFDEKIADNVIEDLLNKIENEDLDWGEAIGIVQQGLAD